MRGAGATGYKIGVIGIPIIIRTVKGFTYSK